GNFIGGVPVAAVLAEHAVVRLRAVAVGRARRRSNRLAGHSAAAATALGRSTTLLLCHQHAAGQESRGSQSEDVAHLLSSGFVQGSFYNRIRQMSQDPAPAHNPITKPACDSFNAGPTTF